jgi:hypothetical protein
VWFSQDVFFTSPHPPHQPLSIRKLTKYSHLSSNEYAQLEGKKTIQPADVIAALKENEFEHFIPRLEAELKSNIDPFYVKIDHY